MGKPTRVTNAIRVLRFAKGEMTQAELADRIGVTRQTIIAIEQGRYSPSLEVAFQIARVLEGLVERHVEHSRDLERHLEGWRVAPLLDGDDGLAGDADAICQVRLCHLSVREPERSNGVGDLGWLHHGYKPVGCNYSVHGPDLQVRDSGVVPAWPTEMPPSGRLPGLRGYFAEPSLSGKHSTP